MTAEQFAWSFKYPDGGKLRPGRSGTGEPVRPAARSTPKDVIHSFWVPEFGQKQDAVPGIETTLLITPTRIGTYPSSAQSCAGSAMR